MTEILEDTVMQKDVIPFVLGVGDDPGDAADNDPAREPVDKPGEKNQDDQPDDNVQNIDHPALKACVL